MKQKVILWDILRKRMKVDVQKLNLKQWERELERKFGDSGITRYFSKPGVFEWLKEKLVKKKIRGKVYYSTKPKKWTKSEIRLLRRLGKKYRGSMLVHKFNKIVSEPRSYRSITNKFYRLNKKKGGD